MALFEAIDPLHRSPFLHTANAFFFSITAAPSFIAASVAFYCCFRRDMNHLLIEEPLLLSGPTAVFDWGRSDHSVEAAEGTRLV